ncbi:hypothetical protein RHDC3_02610 [Rhodocyclaceae bacterium]|nr:hypothetical protein RHDC3_02610 [Rhodocyclaceae bacterium]
MLFDKAMRMGIGFLVTVWITRYLGPEQFGLFSYAVAFVSLFAAVANLGLYGIVVRDFVRSPGERDAILGTALFLKTVAGLVAFALAVGAIALLRPGDQQMLLLVTIAAAGLIFQAGEAFDFWFQSQLRSRITVLGNLPGFVIITAVKVGLILWGAPLEAFAWAAVVETLLGAIGLAAAYHVTAGGLGSLRVRGGWVKSLLRDSWPLVFGGLMLMVFSRIDQVMLGQMLGGRAVGVYAAAVKVAEFWYFVPLFTLNSLLPTIVEARAGSSEEYQRRLQQMTDAIAVIAYCFMVPLAVAAGPIATLLYGEAYAGAGPILGIYVLSSVFVMMGHVREYWVAAENIAMFSLVATAVGAVLNVALNLVLIPAFGAVGAAWATLAAIVVSGYLINACHSRTRMIFVIQSRALLLRDLFRLLRGGEARG